MAAWRDLLKNLRDFARLQPEMIGVNVEGGQPPAFPRSPAILILRDDERNGARMVGGGRTGNVNLIVELWETSEDPDPMAGYDKLANLEDKFKDVVDRWVLTGPAGYDVSDYEIPESSGDVDQHRPDVAGRLSISIQWSKYGA